MERIVAMPFWLVPSVSRTDILFACTASNTGLYSADGFYLDKIVASQLLHI